MMSIKDDIKEMCRIEFEMSLEELTGICGFFIDDVSNSFIIWNYNEDVNFSDFINIYFDVEKISELKSWLYGDYEMLHIQLKGDSE